MAGEVRRGTTRDTVSVATDTCPGKGLTGRSHPRPAAAAGSRKLAQSLELANRVCHISYALAQLEPPCILCAPLRSDLGRFIGGNRDRQSACLPPRTFANAPHPSPCHLCPCQPRRSVQLLFASSGSSSAHCVGGAAVDVARPKHMRRATRGRLPQRVAPNVGAAETVKVGLSAGHFHSSPLVNAIRNAIRWKVIQGWGSMEPLCPRATSPQRRQHHWIWGATQRVEKILNGGIC